MKHNIVADKSYAFAIRIVKLYRYLTTSKKEFILSKQLVRSGTAIGALIREAEHAQSKADFIHKMNIALKEANETEYWIMLLKDTDILNEKEYKNIIHDSKELIKMLISIVKTTRESIKH